MKIFILTDLHSQTHIFPRLSSALDRLQPDIVFCLGDLTDGKRTAVAYTEAFLTLFEERGLPLLCISGNNDAAKSLSMLEARGCLIDYRERSLGDIKVVGLGYHASESPFVPDLRDAVLLSHLPPRRNSVPAHVKNIPRFHFAGHFHSRATTWPLGGTTVVQVPTAQDYRAAVLRLPEGVVEFIRFG